MYRLLNARFFNGELPEVVISLKKTVGAYGHFTCSKVWQAGDERRYEINISSATLIAFGKSSRNRLLICIIGI